MKNEKEAHESLSLLFHRDGLPYVMVMDVAKVQVQCNFRWKLCGAESHIKSTDHYTASSNLGEGGVRELNR
jgi:hypothetical protein